MIKKLSFDHEQQYWQQNICLVAGIDEAGMGALAGPVVAAAVIFRKDVAVKDDRGLIRDSKRLSPKQREKAAVLVKESALAWATGEASVEEITHLNIRRASHLAMRRAVDNLSDQPELLLIDGTPAQPHSLIPAVNIIDGDALVFSIAAASILAKVHRDTIMTALDAQYPQYGFAKHKGYGSSLHLAALKEHGVCPYHRPTYAPVTAYLQAK